MPIFFLFFLMKSVDNAHTVCYNKTIERETNPEQMEDSMKYNKRDIMTEAWNLYRMSRNWTNSATFTFSHCLHRAWEKAKEARKIAAEVAAKGIIRMHYGEYKRNYSDCMTVEGSYDKATKTIEVMTKVKKRARQLIDRMVTSTRSGLCPRCHTYCYGDCYING